MAEVKRLVYLGHRFLKGGKLGEAYALQEKCADVTSAEANTWLFSSGRKCFLVIGGIYEIPVTLTGAEVTVAMGKRKYTGETMFSDSFVKHFEALEMTVMHEVKIRRSVKHVQSNPRLMQDVQNLRKHYRELRFNIDRSAFEFALLELIRR